MSEDDSCCDDCCCDRKTTSEAQLLQTEGYKDEYRIEVAFDEPVDAYHPKMREMMTLVHYLYEAEDHAFPDGYGRQMPWFYFSLLALGYEDEVYGAIDAEGYKAKEKFDDLVDQHADEVIWLMKELRGEARQ